MLFYYWYKQPIVFLLLFYFELCSWQTEFLNLVSCREFHSILKSFRKPSLNHSPPPSSLKPCILTLTPWEVGKRTYLLAACYTLWKKEKTSFCECLKSVKVPQGYSSKVNNLVSMYDLKLIDLKSHDCHILMQQILLMAIRWILPKNVRHTITRLCSFFLTFVKFQMFILKLSKITEVFFNLH